MIGPRGLSAPTERTVTHHPPSMGSASMTRWQIPLRYLETMSCPGVKEFIDAFPLLPSISAPGGLVREVGMGLSR